MAASHLILDGKRGTATISSLPCCMQAGVCLQSRRAVTALRRQSQAFFPRVPRFPDPHSQVANARTIEGGWEFNCVPREESNIEHRKLGPDVWSYRWWESGPNGNRVHRRIVLGTAEQLRDLSSARQMTTGLMREINATDIRMAGTSIGTVG